MKWLLMLSLVGFGLNSFAANQCQNIFKLQISSDLFINQYADQVFERATGQTRPQIRTLWGTQVGHRFAMFKEKFNLTNEDAILNLGRFLKVAHLLKINEFQDKMDDHRFLILINAAEDLAIIGKNENSIKETLLQIRKIQKENSRTIGLTTVDGKHMAMIRYPSIDMITGKQKNPDGSYNLSTKGMEMTAPLEIQLTVDGDRQPQFGEKVKSADRQQFDWSQGGYRN